VAITAIIRLSYEQATALESEGRRSEDAAEGNHKGQHFYRTGSALITAADRTC